MKKGEEAERKIREKPECSENDFKCSQQAVIIYIFQLYC